MGFVEKLLIEKVLKVILKKFKLDKLLDYMEKPNELDIGVAELRARIERLEEKVAEPHEKMYKEDKVDYKKSLKYKGDK
tara:strand:- start:2944 stop:3180 length:237 start_codon:yes stop_codon:yes gene_type:complete